MKRTVFSIAVLLALTSMASLAVEKTPQPGSNAFKTKTKSVAIFKDGYGFFLREGKATLHDGWCMTDYIPKATTGSFWLYTLESGTMVNTVRSTGRNEIKFESAQELGEALRRYLGMQVSLQGEEGVIEGEMIEVVNEMALVKSGSKVGVVKLADIKSARIIGNPLLVQVDGPKQIRDVTLKMGYLQQGINWTPTYTLDLVSPKEVKINLRATVTNSVEDLAGCKIFFVVGVPNFSLKGQLDPLTVHSVGSAVLSFLPSGAAGSYQAVSNASIADVSRDAKADTFTYTIHFETTTVEGLQDLYFYEKEGLDIAAGDVVMTTIMNDVLPYRSVFSWSVDAGSGVDHFIALINNLAVPLTTGPVMVVQNGKPLGQDQMKYISPKSEGRLKLTQTTDIRTDSSEREVERRPVEQIDRASYVPVVSEGKLVIENYRKEAAEIEVSWTVEGKVLEASDDAQVRTDTKANQGLNPKNSLKCTVKIEPGGKHTVTYKYLRYVSAKT